MSARPDIVMLDDEMPGPDVGPTVLQILRESPRTKVVLTAQDDPEIVLHLGSLPGL